MTNQTSGVFEFLDAYRPPAKPRDLSITIANDRRLSHEGVRSLMEIGGNVLDHIKIVDHYGLVARFDESWLKEKLAIYHEAGVATTLGGALYEVAVVQNKVEQFAEKVATLGFHGFEVSEDIIEPQSREERTKHIKLGKDLGLYVFTEIGRKFPDSPFDAQFYGDIALEDLDAGAELIVVENSDVIDMINTGSDGMHRLVEIVPFEKLVFEMGPAESMRAASWLIKEFGPSVNLENMEIEDVPVVAAMRAGLHRRVGFSYFDKWKVEAAE